MTDFLIREAQPSDWPAIREICCLTGAGGNPIESARRNFFPEIWVRPYAELCSPWTLVACEGDYVVGYLTGCPDTRTFKKQRPARVDWPLALEILAGRYGWSGDTKNQILRTLGLKHFPEKKFGPERQELWERDYPGHLHINLRAQHRKSGLGTQLMEGFFARLREAQIIGAHLYCGAGAVAFYRRTGFQELARIEFKRGVEVYAFGRKS